MKFSIAAFSAAALGLAVASGSYADTRNSNDRETMERKASPAAPKSDEERAEASQGQPNVPNSIGGAYVRDTPKDKVKAGKPDKTSSSAGTSAVAADADKEQAFKRLDIDGDGSISKAEASGNAQLMNAFGRSDKDRDGKLSRSEYASVGEKKAEQAEAKMKTKAKAGQARLSP